MLLLAPSTQLYQYRCTITVLGVSAIYSLLLYPLRVMYISRNSLSNHFTNVFISCSVHSSFIGHPMQVHFLAKPVIVVGTNGWVPINLIFFVFICLDHCDRFFKGWFSYNCKPLVFIPDSESVAACELCPFMYSPLLVCIFLYFIK